MKKRHLVLVLVALSACTQSPPAQQPQTPEAPLTPPEEPIDQPRIDIYEAAFRGLYETEGWYDPVVIDERICADAASISADRCRDAFTDEEQQAVVAALSDLPSVRFTDRARAIRKRIFKGYRSAGLLSVGPIDGAGDRVEIAGSAYCGGLCGHWMTMVLESRGRSWRFTHTVGGVMIA